MRSLVTGADGFVGRWLVKALLDKGHDVVAMTRSVRKSTDKHVESVQADLLDHEGLKKTLDQVGAVDHVFHLAALLPSDAICLETYNKANAGATEIVLAWAKENGVKSLVFMSTVAVIGSPQERPISDGHPVDPKIDYARSKLNAEAMVAKYHADGFAVTAMRLSSPYGPGMKTGSVLPLFVGKAMAGEVINWHGDGSRAQDFIEVRDAAALCIGAALLPYEKMPSHMNLGSGAAVSMKRLAQDIQKSCPAVQISASGKDDPQEGIVWEMDMSKTRALLPDIEMTPFETGIAGYIAALPSQGPVWWE